MEMGRARPLSAFCLPAGGAEQAALAGFDQDHGPRDAAVGVYEQHARGGGDDLVFQENQMVCTEDYTISNTWSAVSAGPIEIEDGVSIEVPDNQSWVVR